MTLDELAQLREGWDFEAKLAGGRNGRGAVPASFFETYSAMANTDGGVIVLGLAERKDGSFDAVGLADAARVEQEVWDLLDNRQKVSANVLARRDVSVERAGDRDVLVVRVPRAHRTARPVFLGGNPMNSFRRSGQGDRRCTEPEVRRMVADASDVPADSAVVEGYGLDALDTGTIEVWRNLFSAVEPRHPFLQGDVISLLRSIGAWRADAGAEQEGPTVAGLLMFGRERPILDRFPWYQLDYREIDERRPDLRWIDRVTIDGKWPGNVFSFFLRVEPKLVADLKVPFKLAPNMQRIDSTPAHEGLREALVNTLIHADYTGTRGIRVFKRRRSFEFINPGLLRVPWSVAVLGNASDPRNPSLQKMFQLVGFGDRAGSGVPKITLAWREEGWPAPQVSEDFDAQEARLVLDIGHLDPDPVADPVTPRTDPVADPVADPVTPRTDPVIDRVTVLIDPVGRVLGALRCGPLAPSDLQTALGLKHRPTFRANYLRPALDAGLIEPTLPDKPNSRLQKYRLTPAGVARLSAHPKDSDP
jgi:ATP-dependent DNA helicase RecG